MKSENRVFVKSMRGKALMPTSNRKARILLKQGKAKIVCYNPFTIQLKYPTGETTQPIELGIEPNYNDVGIAVVSQEKVLHKSEIHFLPGMRTNLKSKSALRKARRGRKTRYRKHRCSNRANRWQDMTPSSRNKLRHYIKWINKFKALLPNCTVCIVCADPLEQTTSESNDSTTRTNRKPFRNIRMRVFERDGYRCQICGRTNVKLRLHHIRFKSKNGRNDLDNLITVCDDCHSHENHLPGNVLDNLRQQKRVCESKSANTDYPLSRKIHAQLKQVFPDIISVANKDVLNRCTTLGLATNLYNKAIAVTGINQLKQDTNNILQIKQYRTKDRSIHNSVPIKGRKEPNRNATRRNTNTRTYKGWVKNDKVRVFGTKVGFITGFGNYVACVKDINGKYITDPTRKNYSVNLSSLKFLCHNNNWQYQTVRCE